MEKIKILREKTGVGIVDCKLALEEAGGNMEKAIEILRKKGIAKAAKRSDREAQEGVIKLAVIDDKKGLMVGINAETDFVVRSEKFQQFTNKLINLIKEKQPKDLEELMILNLENASVKETSDNLSGVIGEKLDIKRYDILVSNGTVAGYSHTGGKVGVLVSLDKTGKNELAHEIAMQIAAANPKYITPEQVPAEEVTKEKEIYREQLKKESKPENIIEKIINGKINKYYEEVCLVKQEFIKDETKRVSDILGEVKVESFIRYSL